MRLPFLIAAGVLAAGQLGVAAVKVHVDVDKTFDFRQVRTLGVGAEPGMGHGGAHADR